MDETKSGGLPEMQAEGKQDRGVPGHEEAACQEEERLWGVVPKDFTAVEELHELLIRTIRKYRPSTDLSAVEKAYQVALGAHQDQKRKSGEP